VNHSKTFVDPSTGAFINRTEGIWGGGGNQGPDGKRARNEEGRCAQLLRSVPMAHLVFRSRQEAQA
ncbi:hypothetical protein PHYSODRAFT_535824, partial [Phytophthora sojae]